MKRILFLILLMVFAYSCSENENSLLTSEERSLQGAWDDGARVLEFDDSTIYEGKGSDLYPEMVNDHSMGLFGYSLYIKTGKYVVKGDTLSIVFSNYIVCSYFNEELEEGFSVKDVNEKEEFLYEIIDGVLILESLQMEDETFYNMAREEYDKTSRKIPKDVFKKM